VFVAVALERQRARSTGDSHFARAGANLCQSNHQLCARPRGRHGARLCEWQIVVDGVGSRSGQSQRSCVEDECEQFRDGQCPLRSFSIGASRQQVKAMCAVPWKRKLPECWRGARRARPESIATAGVKWIASSQGLLAMTRKQLFPSAVRVGAKRWV